MGNPEIDDKTIYAENDSAVDDRDEAAKRVLDDLDRAEERARREGWVDDEQIQEIMGLIM